MKANFAWSPCQWCCMAFCVGDKTHCWLLLCRKRFSGWLLCIFCFSSHLICGGLILNFWAEIFSIECKCCVLLTVLLCGIPCRFGVWRCHVENCCVRSLLTLGRVVILLWLRCGCGMLWLLHLFLFYFCTRVAIFFSNPTVRINLAMKWWPLLSCQ